MAFCPSCKGEMEQTAAICPHCGFGFPETSRSISRRGFAYSTVANVALIMGQIVTGIGCLLTLVASLVALSHGELIDGLVRGPITFFVLLALLVVFVRVQD